MLYELTSTLPDSTQKTEQVPSEQSDFALFCHMIALNEEMIDSFTVTRKDK